MMLAMLMIMLLVFIMLGMEIAWAIGAACLIYMVVASLMGEGIPFILLPQQMLDGIDTFSLIAIPLFILAGELMAASGITERLVRMAMSFIGHRTGGLANVSVATNFVLGGVSGSAIADAAATGTITIPEMKKRGYPAGFASAVVAASATVAPIIPPSIMFVLLAAIVNISVGQLFLAGVVPGILMTMAMLIVTYAIARRHGYAVSSKASWRERGESLLSAALPLLAPLIILRTISSGVATPTEAAGVLGFYMLILGAFAFRMLNFTIILRCAANAMLLSSIIMLTVGAANVFSWLALYEEFGVILTTAMFAISDNPYILLIVLNILLLLLGTFMDALAVMLLLGPIIFPVFTSIGVDPVHLGVVMVINLTLGLLTPPVGILLNVVALIGKVELTEVFRAVMPYLLALISVLLAVTFIPTIALWLPRWLMPV